MTGEFKEGQVVRLRSGGPCMTVQATVERRPAPRWASLALPSPWGIYCIWQDAQGILQRMWFDPITLEDQGYKE